MNLPIASLLAAAAGLAAAFGVAVMPTPLLEGLVMDSGLPAVLAAAEPPLGTTARIALGLGVGAFAAAFAWIAVFVLFGTRTLTIGRAQPVPADEEVPTPVVRRADAHPDAPPRPPLLATRDLGTPFFEPRHAEISVAPLSESAPAAVEAPEPVAAMPEAPVERPLPVDLNQPMAAFDPQAIPDVPLPHPEPVTPHRPATFDASERFETFELTPPVRPAVPPPARTDEAIVRPETDASIQALLDRLERGVVNKRQARRRPAPRPSESERGLEQALATLRNLARSA